MSNRHNHLLSFAVAVAALGSAGAMAQTMGFGCPTPGTKITNSAGATVVMGKQEGFFCKADHSAFGAGEVYAMLYYFNPTRRRDPSVAKYIDPVAAERIWPLTVGKRYTGKATLGGGTYTLDYAVTGTETLATPMGPQPTFVVELNESGTDGYTAKQKWWLSPTFKYVLKGEFSDSRGANVKISTTGIAGP